MSLNMSYIIKRIGELKKKKERIENILEDKGVDIQILENDDLYNEFSFQLKAKTLKDLKVACIMDKFTLESYNPECRLLQITPMEWKNEIDEFEPDLLFIESAWQGVNGLWYRKIANGSEEIFALTNYCRENKIPIVFWNKEDPIYTDTFMPTAKCADYVFTTDIDCIKKYKECLKHNRVYLLHFAAQPKLHNPVEKYRRQNKFCFAGAYYHRYPQRAETFDKFTEIFIETKGLDIYDRNYQNSRPEHAFPEKYNPYILGSLESEEIDKAYKGYIFGINMNSVEQSQTMFARRVFEMLASNTITVGNYSRGIKNLFGDLTLSTNDEKTLKMLLEKWTDKEEKYKNYRLQGLRKVLSEHLYEDRLAYVVRKVFGVDIKTKLPKIKLILQGEDIESGIKQFEKLNYADKELYIISNSDNYTKPNIITISKREAECIKINDLTKDAMVGVIKNSNYYGPNYLLDLSLGQRYSDASAFGKACFFRYNNKDFHLSGKDASYKATDSLKPDRTIFSRNVKSIQNMNLLEFLQVEDVSDYNMLSVDEYNFCENYEGTQCEIVDDLFIADQGISISELERCAENIRASQIENMGRVLSIDEILTWTSKEWKGQVTCERLNEGIVISSNLEQDEKKYIYMDQTFDLNETANEGKLNLFFGGNGNLEFMGVCLFLDKDKNRLTPAFPKVNINHAVEIPEGAKYFLLGMRVRGKGSYILKHIELGGNKTPNELSCFLNRDKVLVLTNTYPSSTNLYRNMFVHKRVKAYKEQGLVCDVMEFDGNTAKRYREFEDVNIISGQEETLYRILSQSTVKTVCVHFLDRRLWNVLKEFENSIRILVWIHGAEIQPWWRRTCNYKNKNEEIAAKKPSKEREDLWKEVFADRTKYNIHFIFVSQAFADEVFEDYQVELEKEYYSIIHNCIDTDLFKYEPKNIEQRKKILSIRPYANRKYANDLSVKCILELSKKPFFYDLNFCIYGDGELFEETLKPLKAFKNIEIHKGFLRQDEIARLHKEYGVFLVPTRVDAQGVSRDEAMSSGLVPVTNGIPAILEFTDESNAIIAEPEDYYAMAKGIERLYNEPDYFAALSINAAKRVEEQTAKIHTIDKEVSLIRKNNYGKENSEKF